MSEIHMSMDEQWIPLIEKGFKTATTRIKRKGDVGDTFILNGKRYVLTRVLPLPMGDATERFFGYEGFDSETAFKTALPSYYPDLDDDSEVYIHFFRGVGE